MSEQSKQNELVEDDTEEHPGVLNKFGRYEHKLTGFLYSIECDRCYGKQKSDGTISELDANDKTKCTIMGINVARDSEVFKMLIKWHEDDDINEIDRYFINDGLNDLKFITKDNKEVWYGRRAIAAHSPVLKAVLLGDKECREISLPDFDTLPLQLLLRIMDGKPTGNKYTVCYIESYKLAQRWECLIAASIISNHIKHCSYVDVLYWFKIFKDYNYDEMRDRIAKQITV